MELSATALRLLAYVLTFALLAAVINALVLARGRSFDMRHWKLLCMVIATYDLWFFMLAISIRDMELMRRGEMTWLFGAVGLGGAIGGWLWFGLTMVATFSVAPKKPPAHSPPVGAR